MSGDSEGRVPSSWDDPGRGLGMSGQASVVEDGIWSLTACVSRSVGTCWLRGLKL